MAKTRSRIDLPDLTFLFLVMLLGFIIRFDFLYAGNFVIDADEAIVGLMAKHILEGRGVPIFYYGQSYMGSLEAILVALAFKLFGISNFTLQLVPLIFSVLLIPIIYIMTLEVGERTAAKCAALLMAVPPLGLVIWSAKARGGFIEILFIGALALLGTVRWLKRDKIDFYLTALIGILLGLGWWVNNQIIYFVLPIGFFIFCRLIGETEKTWKQRIGLITGCLLVGLCGFMAGSFPFWIYNFTHDFASFGMFHRAPIAAIGKQFLGLFSTALPILLGAKQFWQAAPVFPLATFIAYFVYSVAVRGAYIARKRQILGLFRFSIERNRPLEIFLFFIVISCAVFVVSSFGWLVEAPRYLLPLYVGLFVIVGVGLENLYRREKRPAMVVLGSILAINIFSAYGYGRALPGEPIVYNGERVAKDHSELISWLEQNNYSWVSTNYWIGYRLAFETGERIKFRLIQEPWTVRIRDYQDEADYLPLDKLPLVLVPSQARKIKTALTTLGHNFKTISLSGYEVLYDIHGCDSNAAKVPPESFTIVSNRSQENVHFMVDGQINTRWGAAEPQRAGEEVQVLFPEPMPVKSFEIHMGTWMSDFPRALSVQVEYADGTISEIMDKAAYREVRYLSQSEESTQFCLKGPPVKRIILTQQGWDKIFDWSIAELSVYREKQ